MKRKEVRYEKTMYENENFIKLAGWLLGVIGTLLLLGGGAVNYIFQRHVKENDCQFSKNRDDHREIFQILRDKADKK